MNSDYPLMTSDYPLIVGQRSGRLPSLMTSDDPLMTSLMASLMTSLMASLIRSGCLPPLSHRDDAL